MRDEYILMFLDEELGLFIYDDTEDRFYFEHNGICSVNKIPLELKDPTDENIREWFGDRICPPDRVNIQQILDAMQLSEYDPWEITKFNRGYSGMDALWLKRADSKEKFVSMHLQ